MSFSCFNSVSSAVSNLFNGAYQMLESAWSALAARVNSCCMGVFAQFNRTASRDFSEIDAAIDLTDEALVRAWYEARPVDASSSDSPPVVQNTTLPDDILKEKARGLLKFHLREIFEKGTSLAHEQVVNDVMQAGPSDAGEDPNAVLRGQEESTKELLLAYCVEIESDLLEKKQTHIEEAQKLNQQLVDVFKEKITRLVKGPLNDQMITSVSDEVRDRITLIDSVADAKDVLEFGLNQLCNRIKGQKGIDENLIERIRAGILKAVKSVGPDVKPIDAIKTYRSTMQDLQLHGIYYSLSETMSESILSLKLLGQHVG